MVSSRAWRARTAFIMGWLSVLAWVLTSASTAVVCAQMVGVIANFYHEDFVMTQWQTYLVFVLMIVLMTAYVTLLPRFMPLTEKALFWATLTGFLTMFITVLATSKTKQSASVIFKDYVNITGWSNGTSFMLAVGTCMYIYLATDAATHISEEIPNPGRNVPRAIIGTCIIGFCTVFPWMIAFLFSTNDLAAVSASLFPILEVYYQALDSHAGATFFICWLLFLYFGAGITCVATAGRLTWAFARDGGLPFSATFARIHPTQKAPVNATILAAAVQIAYGAIYVGSTAAFNTIINMAIISLNITYAIPQGIVLVRGRDKVLPKRYFDLGPYLGTLCNAFSCVWVSLYTVLFCFPTWMPAEVPSMNYLSVVLVGIVAIILAMWFLGKRKTFTGPVSNPLSTFEWEVVVCMHVADLKPECHA
jgi:choline transport protein